MNQYTIDDLFQSVNDIYTQFDDGDIELEQAVRILRVCCKQFIESNPQKKD